MVDFNDKCEVQFNGIHVRFHGGTQDIYDLRDNSITHISRIYCCYCGKRLENETKIMLSKNIDIKTSLSDNDWYYDLNGELQCYTRDNATV